MRMIKTSFIAIAVILCASAALAGPITVSYDLYQQTDNSPCVIGNDSCTNKNSDDFHVFVPSHDQAFSDNPWVLYSPYYVVGAGDGIGPVDVIPSRFSVGFDANFAQGQDPEFLVFFEVYRMGTTTPTGFPGTGGVDQPSSPGTKDDLNSFNPIASYELTPGNGYSDIVLNGFELPVGEYVYFRASVQDEVAGFGQFFIIPEGTAQVPEPSLVLLLGLGLGAVGLVPKRKK